MSVALSASLILLHFASGPVPLTDVKFPTCAGHAEPLQCSVPPVMQAAVFSSGRFTMATRSTPEPRARQLLVRVEAAAVNRIDAMMAHGKLGKVDIVGLDISGIVVARGDSCTSNISVGDRVLGLISEGGYASYALVDERDVLARPARLSAVEAAAVPEVWMTAWQLLFDIGKARAGDRVLIHAAGSGVGLAAVQLAATHGLHVVAAASTDVKLKLARQLGAIVGFNWKAALGLERNNDANDNSSGHTLHLAASRRQPFEGSTKFRRAIYAASNEHVNSSNVSPNVLCRSRAPTSTHSGGVGHCPKHELGIDLVLDCVGGGAHGQQHLDLLDIDGRWVLFGLLGGSDPPPALFGALLRKRIQLLSTTLRSRAASYKRRLLGVLSKQILPFLRAEVPRNDTQCARTQDTKDLRIIIDSTFPLSEAQGAHDRMLANTNVGKIVLQDDIGQDFTCFCPNL